MSVTQQSPQSQVFTGSVAVPGPRHAASASVDVAPATSAVQRVVSAPVTQQVVGQVTAAGGQVASSAQRAVAASPVAPAVQAAAAPVVARANTVAQQVTTQVQRAVSAAQSPRGLTVPVGGYQIHVQLPRR